MTRINAPKWPVMHAILAQGALDPTHPQIAEAASVGERTVSKVVSALKDDEFLTGGRKTKLGPGLGLTLGISIGSGSLRAALVDANGDMHCLSEDDRSTDQLSVPPRILLKRIRSIACAVLEEGLAQPDLMGKRDSLALHGVAVAWPTPVDRSKRPRGRSLSDGTWRKRDEKTRLVPTLSEWVAREFGLPFTVNRCHAVNDGSAAAIGVAFLNSRERAGEPKDDQWRVSLVIRAGGGLGSGVVLQSPHREERLSFIDSQLIEGTNGLAGELGHLPIGRKLIEEINEACPIKELKPISYDDWRCSCGHKHHLEAFAGGTAVLRRLRESSYEIPSGKDAKTGLMRDAIEVELDETLALCLRDAGKILGRALAGPILVLDPHSITITGSLASDEFLDGIRRNRDYWANAIDDSVKLESVSGEDGAFIGVRGAALSVIRRVVYRRFLDKRSDRPKTFEFGATDLEALATSAGVEGD